MLHCSSLSQHFTRVPRRNLKIFIISLDSHLTFEVLNKSYVFMLYLLLLYEVVLLFIYIYAFIYTLCFFCLFMLLCIHLCFLCIYALFVHFFYFYFSLETKFCKSKKIEILFLMAICKCCIICFSNNGFAVHFICKFDALFNIQIPNFSLH